MRFVPYPFKCCKNLSLFWSALLVSYKLGGIGLDHCHSITFFFFWTITTMLWYCCHLKKKGGAEGKLKASFKSIIHLTESSNSLFQVVYTRMYMYCDSLFMRSLTSRMISLRCLSFYEFNSSAFGFANQTASVVSSNKRSLQRCRCNTPRHLYVFYF